MQPSHAESTPPSKNIHPFYKGRSQNLALPPRIYLLFYNYSDAPRIYPPPPPTTYLLLNTYMRPSQNIPISPRTYSPLLLNMYTYMHVSHVLHFCICSDCKIKNIYMRPSQNLPFLPEYTPPPFKHLYIRPSQNLPLPPRIYPLFYLRTSQNLPSLS